MTDRQKKIMSRAYDLGFAARGKGIGLKNNGKLYDYQQRDKAAGTVAQFLGAYPGNERDDAIEAYLNGWNEKDYRLYLQRDDERTYAHAYGA